MSITTPPAGILVSDFDGTMTQHDFYDLVCREFPEILKGGHWQHYEEGRITHFEALRRIFAEIRTDEDRLLTIVERMELEPKLKESVENLRGRGWEVIVASAGCSWYIRRLLAAADVDVEVNANPGEFSPEKGLTLIAPTTSCYYSADLGINKLAVVKRALERSGRVAYAGDGRPDLAPALLVRPEWRFARSWLATKLREIDEAFRPYASWSEIAQTLLRES